MTKLTQETIDSARKIFAKTQEDGKTAARRINAKTDVQRLALAYQQFTYDKMMDKLYNIGGGDHFCSIFFYGSKHFHELQAMNLSNEESNKEIAALLHKGFQWYMSDPTLTYYGTVILLKDRYTPEDWERGDGYIPACFIGLESLFFAVLTDYLRPYYPELAEICAQVTSLLLSQDYNERNHSQNRFFTDEYLADHPMR